MNIVNVPPYNADDETMLSPTAARLMIALKVAEVPLETANAPISCAPDSKAKRRSSTSVVGLPSLLNARAFSNSAQITSAQVAKVAVLVQSRVYIMVLNFIKLALNRSCLTPSTQTDWQQSPYP